MAGCPIGPDGYNSHYALTCFPAGGSGPFLSSLPILYVALAFLLLLTLLAAMLTLPVVSLGLSWLQWNAEVAQVLGEMASTGTAAVRLDHAVAESGAVALGVTLVGLARPAR